MTLTLTRLLPAFLLVAALSAQPAAVDASDRRSAPGNGTPRHSRAAPARGRTALSTAERLDLFAPRVRRSTIAYLRLRLLELREEGLDRARAAIERRLSVDELIAGPPRAHVLRAASTP